jgi:hypothetical protein
MERQDRDAERDAGFYEMQQRPAADGDVKLSRLQTMGVVQKLNKAAGRSKLEGRVLLTQKLAIFFAAVGLALSIIEQETLWCLPCAPPAPFCTYTPPPALFLGR